MGVRVPPSVLCTMTISALTEVERWVLQDLIHHRVVASNGDMAERDDYRLAVYLRYGKTLRTNQNPYENDFAKYPDITYEFDFLDRVRRKRLRVLQKLQRLRIIQSYWQGTGRGGVTWHGLHRMKGYILTDPNFCLDDTTQGVPP